MVEEEENDKLGQMIRNSLVSCNVLEEGALCSNPNDWDSWQFSTLLPLLCSRCRNEELGVSTPLNPTT